MSASRVDEMNVLKLSLHERLVGYLAGFQGGRNVLSFAEEFKNDAGRPTFSLITHPAFPHSEKIMAEPWARNQTTASLPIQFNVGMQGLVAVLVPRPAWLDIQAVRDKLAR